jgi:hypothetical protein
MRLTVTAPADLSFLLLGAIGGASPELGDSVAGWVQFLSGVPKILGMISFDFHYVESC